MYKILLPVFVLNLQKFAENNRVGRRWWVLAGAHKKKSTLSWNEMHNVLLNEVVVQYKYVIQ